MKCWFRWAMRVAMLLAIVPAAAWGDSWVGSSEKDYPSPNGKFVAHITSGKNANATRLSVRRASDKTEIWSAKLFNPDSPVNVVIADDGEHVLAMDDWHRVGYGDHVLAFYDRHGLIKKYSLEQIFGVSDPKEMWALKIPTSVSSRWWRSQSIDFLDGQQWVIWLGWCEQWMAWDMTTGEPIEATPAIAEKWNTIANARAMEMIKSRDTADTAMRFLAKSRTPEVRKLIEAQLADDRFGGGPTTTSQGNEPARLVSLNGESWLRRTADEMLAKWDGRERKSDKYLYLGNVSGTLRLPQDAPNDCGMYVYLVPHEGKVDQWAAAKPVQRVRGRFYPFHKVVIGQSVPFNINGVTPGKYWIKAVFDVAKPLHEEQNDVYAGEAGDFESSPRKVIDVRIGEVTDAGEVNCTTRIGG